MPFPVCAFGLSVDGNARSRREEQRSRFSSSPKDIDIDQRTVDRTDVLPSETVRREIDCSLLSLVCPPSRLTRSDARSNGSIQIDRRPIRQSHPACACRKKFASARSHDDPIREKDSAEETKCEEVAHLFDLRLVQAEHNRLATSAERCLFIHDKTRIYSRTIRFAAIKWPQRNWRRKHVRAEGTRGEREKERKKMTRSPLPATPPYSRDGTCAIVM